MSCLVPSALTLVMSYTVIGDIVNTASRLERVNKVFGAIIISDESARLDRPPVQTCELDLIIVAGKTEPLRVHELIYKTDQLTAE
ncbi:MAG: adenylate cyclase [Chitinophagales bacterium]|jgi:adenylate cyclase